MGHIGEEEEISDIPIPEPMTVPETAPPVPEEAPAEPVTAPESEPAPA